MKMLITILLIVWLKKVTFCTDIMKKYFNKDLVMTKEDYEHFGSYIKCCIFDDVFVEDDVNVRDHSHITRKYRGSTDRDYNIYLQLNHKSLLVFHNLKNYDSPIMQELCKFNFERKVMPNGLEKYMHFSINNKLIFIDRYNFYVLY